MTKQDLAEDPRTEEAHPEETSDAAAATDARADREPPTTTADAAPAEAPDPAAGDDSPTTAAGAASDAEEATTADTTSDSEEPTAASATSDGAEPAGTGGGRFTRARVVGALAAMLVAAIAATAVLQWISAAQAEDASAKLTAERSLRLEVSGAASAFSKALLSYDYQDLQSTRSTLAAQATGDFLGTYDAAFGGAMAQVIVKLKATSQATVREVYLADVDEATAHAIVVVDQQVNTSEAIRSVKDSHLKISLVKEKGVWKVHDVTVLGAASEDQYNLTGDDKKKD
ncbi:hypothetical protein ACFLIM_02330 [Nonomuraea sp. M3C6]|uniref:Mce-associated membrane protein n=1 Tax=Nonomuraea marmarensis TaxID=3351344 RepID=A0ABW7A3U9_9ACTN